MLAVLFWPLSGLADDLPRPLTDADFIAFDPAQARIGQLLFYDKILSGNRNISCATCHHPKFGTSDGLSLGIGEGGEGLGPDRTAGVGESRVLRRVPRNAPGLWNLGTKDVHIFMHDGRISISDTYENGFNTPAEEWLPEGLNSLLAAQALFPLTAETEMAGQSEENEVAGAVNDRIDKGWPILAKRVRAVPAYGQMFVEAFDNITRPEEVTIVEIANAMAAFMALEFRSTDSPFDHYLAGDDTALDEKALAGMQLFYGEAGCSACHSGPLTSDQGFYALGLPPFGPGRTRKFDLISRDVGRLGESDDLADAYRFRTPMLRNVALTAPYGHNGAFQSLDDMIRQHVAPLEMLALWQPADAHLPDIPWLNPADFLISDDPREMDRQQAAIKPSEQSLSEADIEALVAFLTAMTGASTPRLGSPARVPSGLPVD